MDTIKVNNIKAEKANAILKQRQLRKLANWFRAIEICALLVLVSRFSTQLPHAVKNYGEYFKDLKVVLVSTRFVFILGNAIVVILFVKSGQFSAKDSAKQNSSSDSFEELVEKSVKSQNIDRYEIEYREKQSICRENVVSDNTQTSWQSKNYRRSQSENFKHVNCEKSCRELRRSGTEKHRKSTSSGERLVKTSYPEDSMSNEEFRRTVEAFIARQQRFRMEEEYSVV